MDRVHGTCWQKADYNRAVLFANNTIFKLAHVMQHFVLIARNVMMMIYYVNKWLEKW